jgi:hypothetical protein
MYDWPLYFRYSCELVCNLNLLLAACPKTKQGGSAGGGWSQEGATIGRVCHCKNNAVWAKLEWTGLWVYHLYVGGARALPPRALHLLVAHGGTLPGQLLYHR